MRVLHLIDHLGLGGAQEALLDLLETRSAGVEPSVWSLSGRALPRTLGRLDAAGVPCRRLRFRKLDPRAPFRLRAALRELRPDLLHTHLEFSNTFGTLAAATLGSRRLARIASIDNDPRAAYGALHRFALARLAPRVDLHLCVSPSVREAVRAVCGARARRIEAVPPGVDLSRFDPARVDLSRVGELRGGARRVVGAVGRLAPQKAFHLLIDALPDLLEEEPSTRLLLVGDGPLRPSLERRAAQAGVGGAVNFTGRLADVAPAYAAMDVFVLPSLHEGFGIVYLEAMAMGVPVVGTRVVGSVDAVEDGVTGLLAPPGDPASLARAILQVLGDPELRGRLREGAFRAVRSKGSREAATRRIEAFYREIAGDAAGRVESEGGTTPATG